MATLEENRIVIQLPKLRWRSLLVIFSLLLSAGGFGFWYKTIRPFFWIETAHVETFCTLLSADMAGRIVEMGPAEGDLVRKGEKLFVLDSDLLRSKKGEGEQLIHFLLDQIELDKERIEKAMESYIAASSELDLGIGSDELIQKPLKMIDEAQNQVAAAEKKIEAAKSELRSIDLQLKKMSLASPFDGVVLKRTKNPGAVVGFNDPIYVISDPSRVWIEAEIPENKIGLISLGTLARIRLPAYPNQELVGKVSYIGPATVAKSALLPFSKDHVTIPIKISVEGASLPLKGGLSAKVGLKVH